MKSPYCIFKRRGKHQEHRYCSTLGHIPGPWNNLENEGMKKHKWAYSQRTHGEAKKIRFTTRESWGSDEALAGLSKRGCRTGRYQPVGASTMTPGGSPS